MSNDVRITRTYTTRTGIENRQGVPYKERLSSRVEAASLEGLEQALVLFHAKAVQLAPMDTGLLKNSIFYTLNKGGEDIKGVNSFGGSHTIDESMYRAIVEEQGLRKSERAGVYTGYVGTLASHDLDENPTTTTQARSTKGRYEEEVGLDESGSYGRRTVMEYDEDDDLGEGTILAKFSDDTQYAPYVEYGSWNSAPHPFMRPAAEAVRTEIGRILLKAFDAGVNK